MLLVLGLIGGAGGLGGLTELMLDSLRAQGDVEGIIRLAREVGTPEATERAALALIDLGERRRALGLLREGAFRLRDPGLWSTLLWAEFHYGDSSRARELAVKARELFGDSPRILHMAGAVLQNLGALDEAEGCYLAALRLAPDSVGLLVDYGSLLQQTGRPKKALAVLDRAQELLQNLRPQVVEETMGGILEYTSVGYRLQLARGLALTQLGDTLKAIEAFRAALMHRGTEAPLLEAARLLIAQKKWEDALELLRNYEDRFGDTPGFMKLMGFALLGSGEPKAALKYLAGAAVQTPNDDQIHLYLARAFRELKKDSLALREALLAARLSPNPSNKAYLAYMLSVMGELDKAQELMMVMRDQDPNNPYVMALLGSTLNAQGRKRLARKYFEAAARLSPKEYLPKLDEFYRQAGMTRERGETLKKLVEMYPDAAGYWVDLALWEEEHGTPEGAIRAYERAAALISSDSANLMDPDMRGILAMVYNNWGYALLETGGDPEKALSLIMEALSLRPDDPIYLDSAGWAYFKLGNLEQAKLYLERAAQLLREPDPEIYGHLVELYQALGDEEAAQRWREKIK